MRRPIGRFGQAVSPVAAATSSPPLAPTLPRSPPKNRVQKSMSFQTRLPKPSTQPRRSKTPEERKLRIHTPRPRLFHVHDTATLDRARNKIRSHLRPVCQRRSEISLKPAV